MDPYTRLVRNLEGMNTLPEAALARIALDTHVLPRSFRFTITSLLELLPVKQDARAYARVDRLLGVRAIVLVDGDLQLWRASRGDGRFAFRFIERWSAREVRVQKRNIGVHFLVPGHDFSVLRHGSKVMIDAILEQGARLE